LPDAACLAVQIVFGDHDLITPPAENMEVAEMRPEANVHAIRNAWHAVYLEKVQEFNRIVAEFLERNSRS
jgi:pimeloyl-ACP methyl ester carboxylesterase